MTEESAEDKAERLKYEAARERYKQHEAWKEAWLAGNGGLGDIAITYRDGGKS